MILLKDRLAPFHLKEQRVLSCKRFTSLFKRFPIRVAFCLCSSSVSGTLLMPVETAFGAVCLLGRKGVLSWLGGADLGPSLEPCDSRGSSWGTCPVLGESACEMFVSRRLHAASRHSCATNHGQLCRLLWKDTETEGRASYRSRLGCSQTWKGHSWAAGDHSRWLCPTPRAGVKTGK